jgi:hypothetical protein
MNESFNFALGALFALTSISFVHGQSLRSRTDAPLEPVLHFAANQMRMEIPIVYGKDVRDWHYWPAEEDEPETLKVVWRGENAVSKNANSYLRLFETSWTNLVPNVELESIDVVSTMSQPAPFLLAITVE